MARNRSWIAIALAVITGLGMWLAAGPGGGSPPGYPAVSQAAGAVNIAIDPSSKSVTVGDIFTLDIRVSAGTQPVDAVDAFLNFSPQVLQVVDTGGNPATSITPGTALRAVLWNRADNSTGRIDFNAGRRTGDEPASGSFVLATIRFKAMAVGSSFVAFSLTAPRATDASSAGVSVLGSTADGQVTINQAATPTPGGPPTATPAATLTPTPTATASATSTPDLGGGAATPSPTLTATGTVGATLTATPTSVSTSTPTATAPPAGPAPAISSPPDGAFADDMAPLLNWANPPGATQYEVQVIPFNRDGPGVDLVIGDAALVAQASYQVQAPALGVGNYVLLPGMTYTWRVRTSTATAALGPDDPRWGAWSARTFRTPPPISGTISPVSPQSETTVEGLRPTLQWANADTRVFYYEVQVSKDLTFDTDPATATGMVYWELRHGGVTTPQNSYTIPAAFPLEEATTYYWRVRPRVQGDGSSVEWSNKWSFKSP